MSPSERQMMQEEMLSQIQTFVKHSRGLHGTLENDGILVVQSVDKKGLHLKSEELEEVLLRKDHHGVDFLQVNFSSNKKILITDTLIGFKPSQIHNLEMARLPKVVTTPDIQSVFEALHEALGSMDMGMEDEVHVLRRVFDAVVEGGEQVGFDLGRERQEIRRIPHFSARGCA